MPTPPFHLTDTVHIGTLYTNYIKSVHYLGEFGCRIAKLIRSRAEITVRLCPISTFPVWASRRPHPDGGRLLSKSAFPLCRE
jgi:hypothetical protein